MKEFLTKEEINVLPLYRYTGPTHLVRSDEEVRRMLADLAGEKVLGFDTETRPAFRKGEHYLPSLIQLASNNAVYLVQLSALKSLQWFDRLFAAERVLKTGVNIGFDIRQLKELHEFKDKGFVELAELADEAGVKHNGLRGLTAAVLGKRISKGAQRSDWSRRNLTHSQLMYAATDAWVCRELYLKLNSSAQKK